MKLYYVLCESENGDSPVSICESLEKAKASCHIYHSRNTDSDDIIKWGNGSIVTYPNKSSVLSGECGNYEYYIFEVELNEVWLK